MNGGTLIVNGDLTIKESGVITASIRQGGILLVNGGTVIVHGNLILRGGIVDAGSGNISIDRDFEQSGGLMNVNGGRVNISGNYGLSFMQKPLPGATGIYAGKYSYATGDGVLQMVNGNDYVCVGGSFVTTSEISHEHCLTAGTLEVKGDFYQASWAYGCKINDGIADLFMNDAEKSNKNDRFNFKGSGSHRVLLSGSKVQNVGMAVSDLQGSQFNILETTNNTEVKFVTKITVSQLFNHNNNIFTLTDPQNSIFPDFDGDGQRDDIDSTPCPEPEKILIGPGVLWQDNSQPAKHDILNPLRPPLDTLQRDNGLGSSVGEINGTDPINQDPSSEDNTIPIADKKNNDRSVTIPDSKNIDTEKPPTRRPPVVADNHTASVPAGLKASVVGNSVKLQWTGINAENLMGYYIYRSTISGQQVKDPLNGIPILSTEYKDTSVSSGTSYYYTITAFYWDGSHSMPSAEALVIVP